MTKERPFQFKKIKEEEEVVHHLPPAWCGAICRNAMNEICVENCAIKRDCSGFEPKPNLDLIDMPRFPLKKSSSMSKEEKFTVVTVYLAKVVDHLKGIEDREPINPPIRRRDIYDSGSSGLSEDIKIEDLLSGLQEENEGAK